MNQDHSKNVGARVATRFKTSKVKRPASTEYSDIGQRKAIEATLWTLLKLSGLTLVLLVIGLMGFIAGNVWELYPKLSRIDFGVPSDVIIVMLTGCLALSILVWRPAIHTAIISGMIMVIAVYWGININNLPTRTHYTMSNMSEQRSTIVKKPGQQTKPLIVPHMRRRLCLEDGADSDRIECSDPKPTPFPALASTY